MIESTQIMIRRGRLVRQNQSFAKDKSLKTRVKEPSNYHSNEIAVEVASQGPVGQFKALLSRKIYSRRDLDNSSKPNQIRAKGIPPENILLQKERATHSFLG